MFMDNPIWMILACQAYAPYMWMGIPNPYRQLRLIQVVDIPEDQHGPAWTEIKCQYLRNKYIHDLNITIDKSTGRLVRFHDTGDPHLGSSSIGIIFIGIPGTILALPLILVAWLIHFVIRGFSGKSVQDLIIWKRLKGQLPSEVANELDYALDFHRSES